MSTGGGSVRGWLGFAAAVMLLAGVVNVVNGAAAVAADDVVVTGRVGVAVLDVSEWGWVHLLSGAVLVAVGAGLIARAPWARYAAVYLVLFNMITNVLFMPFYPLWSLLVIALDVVVLWALLVAIESPSRAARPPRRSREGAR